MRLCSLHQTVSHVCTELGGAVSLSGPNFCGQTVHMLPWAGQFLQRRFFWSLDQFDMELRPVEGVRLNVLAEWLGAGQTREWRTYSVWLLITRYLEPGDSCPPFSSALSGTSPCQESTCGPLPGSEWEHPLTGRAGSGHMFI